MPSSPAPIPFYGLGPAGGEPGQGEHGQGYVRVPGPPGADLVVIEPGLTLGLGLPRLGGELHLAADARRPAPLRVLSPGPG